MTLDPEAMIEELSGENARLRAALVDMVDAYREGCADEDEPSMVKAALAALARAAP